MFVEWLDRLKREILLFAILILVITNRCNESRSGNAVNQVGNVLSDGKADL